MAIRDPEFAQAYKMVVRGEGEGPTLELMLRWHRWSVARHGKTTYFFAKRITDLVMGTLLFSVALPILFVASGLILLESPGALLFRQRRFGLFGIPFSVYKLRSMTDINGQMRVTRVGKFVRKFKIDELPQLLNVILGDMSLVGPRPLMTTDMVLVDPEYYDRFAVRPGMTGLWQALHTNLIPLKLKQRYDSAYVRKCGFFFDLWLLVRTIPMVLRGEDQIVRKQEEQARQQIPREEHDKLAG